MTILPQLSSSRGLSSSVHGAKCVRLCPRQDATNGFFVACFKRISNRPIAAKRSEDCGAVNATDNKDGVALGMVEAGCGGNTQTTHTNAEGEQATEQNHNKTRKRKKTAQGNAGKAVKLGTQDDTNSVKLSEDQHMKNQTTADSKNSLNGQSSKTKKKRKRKKKHVPVTAVRRR